MIGDAISRGSSSEIILSVVIPCYNEAHTLSECVRRVLGIAGDGVSLEIIIVDDHSTDGSHQIALELAKDHPEVAVHRHDHNQGKGAALRTGFGLAAGKYVAVQDADLEYDPSDLKNLLKPLISNKADVVIGSRFLSAGEHRVLYFWHYLGNRFLTLVSNMFTDLNLTDMETCYKVFRRDVIREVEIKENRFGFEPEIVAKVAQMRVRVYEMGISYHGRTYEEGKKIGVRDGFRALYCIFHYNGFRAPLPIQLAIYAAIGALAGVINLGLFSTLIWLGVSIDLAIVIGFATAACANYFLCILLLFRRGARWKPTVEICFYIVTVMCIGALDFGITKSFMAYGLSDFASRCCGAVSVFLLNFAARRFIVFPERNPSPWRQQEKTPA